MRHGIGPNRREFLRLASALGLSSAAAGLLARAAVADEVLKVGVIYVSPIADIGWTRQHNDAALAIKAALGDRGKLLGFVSAEDKAALINNATCLTAAPEKKEHFGIIYAETLAAGTPCVAYGGGGVDSIVTPDVGVSLEVRTPPFEALPGRPHLFFAVELLPAFSGSCSASSGNRSSSARTMAACSSRRSLSSSDL